MVIRSSFKSLCSVVVFLWIVGLAAPASASPVTVIDFEDVEPGTNGTFVSSGFEFEGGFFVRVLPPDAVGSSKNGTQTLSDADNSLLTLTNIYGRMFDLIAFDLGEGNPQVLATQLFLTAVHADGSVSERLIKLDLIVPDFETATFEGLTDLVSVTFVSDSRAGFSLDNIVVVPEPNCILMLLAGACALLLHKRKRLPVVLLGLFAVLAFEPSTVRAEWTRGPIMIGGDDTDFHFSQAGEHYIQAAFGFLGDHVTNGNTLAVCVGCDFTATTPFDDGFSASSLNATWTTAQVTGSQEIADFFNDVAGGTRISDAGIVYFPSTSGVISGGMTVDEVEVINSHAADLKVFVDNGGGLFTHTLSGMTRVGVDVGYDWLATVVPEILPSLSGEDSPLPITCTAAVATFSNSLTEQQIESIGNAWPYHNIFSVRPGFNWDDIAIIAQNGPDVVIVAAPRSSGFPDCNNDRIIDVCDADCDLNGVSDICEGLAGTITDCNVNGIPDDCEGGCNSNSVPDVCDIANGTSQDCDSNGIPDECGTTDCNGNGLADSCDIANGTSQDCNGNGNGVPDEVEPDCNTNGIPDSCDISQGGFADLDGDGLPDVCEDCNGNGFPDNDDISAGTSFDGCGDGVPDECQDCNLNCIVDDCELLGGTLSFDSLVKTPAVFGCLVRGLLVG